MSINTPEDEKIITYILNLLKTTPEISDKVLKNDLKTQFGLTEAKRIELMSLMHQSGFVQIKAVGDDVVYYTNKGKKKQASDITGIEQKVYELISDSKTEGISKFELKTKTKLNQNIITKMVKNLEKMGSIVSYKTKHKNQYIYVAAEYMPEERLVGGNLFKNGEIDYQFVNKMFKLIEEFVRSKSSVGYTELLGYLTSNEGKFLNEKEIETIINTLLIDKRLVKKGERFELRVKNRFLGDGIEKQVPCFNCPVFDFCKEGSVISPENCVYFGNW